MMSQSSDLRFDNFVHDNVHKRCVATHLKQKITIKLLHINFFKYNIFKANRAYVAT